MSDYIPTKYYGKYRGTVVNNIDPMMEGRINVIVPDVTGVILETWAMPCLPIAGTQSGVTLIPAIGSRVWIEYEQGDADYPIWSGCFYGSAAEVPPLSMAAPPGLPNIVLQTTGQNTLMLSDLPGGPGFMLKTTTGAMIVVSEAGIVISNGKGAVITMAGPAIDFNAGALTIT